ncbi:MAG: amidohydrolase [Chloroflexi bacterium]|nr:amidohydrolase [Chloroflexota bacterium]
MIIDAHTHLMAGPGQPLPSLDAFVDGLHSFGDDKAILFTYEGLWGDPRAGNDALAEAAARYPKVLYPCCSAHPRDGEGALRELHRCAHELGMVGVKLHPWMQSIAATDAATIAFVREAAALGLPVVFHDGTPPFSDTAQVAYVAEQVPTAKVVLGHAGLGNFWPLAIQAAQRFANVYLLVCGPPPLGLRQMAQKVGVRRMLWGSDYPFGGLEAPVYSLAKVQTLPLGDEETAWVLHRSAEALFPALAR